MLTTLRRVALALALVLPTAVHADPPPEGSVIDLMGKRTLACETPEAALRVAEGLIDSPDDMDTTGCAIVRASGPVMVGRSTYVGMTTKAYDEPHMVWIILMSAGGDPRLVVWAEPAISPTAVEV